MRIGEVAKLTGLSDSNIRFYEKKGLLAPARAQESKYRDYTEADVATLKQILLYRKLNLSIETIDAIFRGQLTLKEALVRQETVLLEQVNMLQGSLELCRMLQQEDDGQQIDVDYYLNYVHQEEAKGRHFGEMEELLGDIAEFSRQAFGAGNPTLLLMGMWWPRGIQILSVLGMLVVVGLPVIMIVESVIENREPSIGFIIFWSVWSICTINAFWRFRRRKSNKS